MPGLPVLTPAKAIRALIRAGFLFVRQEGSHRLYQKGDRKVTIAFHGKDIKRATTAAIIEQSGLTAQEFIDLL